MAIGGDLVEITFNHPVLGNGIFQAKAAEDSSYDLGGVRATDDKQGVTGSGTAIYQMNNNRWQFGCVVEWDMNNRDDLGKIALLARHPVDADWTVTHINGVVHGGKGRPVGDYEGNGNTATFDLLLQGGGQFKKIVG
jgi:aromatic ring-cleaving dioxygenase